VGHLTMGMAVKVPSAFQESRPRPAWVVAEEHTLALVGDFQLLRRRLVPSERGDDRMNPVLSLVIMIAEDQDLAAHEPRENASHTVAIVKAHGKVPQVKNDVIRLHDGVPGADQGFVHVTHVCERPVAGCRRQHQRMRKMRIRSVEFCSVGQGIAPRNVYGVLSLLQACAASRAHLNPHYKHGIEPGVLVVIAAWIADDARVADHVVAAVMGMAVHPQRRATALDHGGKIRSICGV
jgi:hypothetical protein